MFNSKCNIQFNIFILVNYRNIVNDAPKFCSNPESVYIEIFRNLKNRCNKYEKMKDILLQTYSYLNCIPSFK